MSCRLFDFVEIQPIFLPKSRRIVKKKKKLRPPLDIDIFSATKLSLGLAANSDLNPRRMEKDLSMLETEWGIAMYQYQKHNVNVISPEFFKKVRNYSFFVWGYFFFTNSV